VNDVNIWEGNLFNLKKIIINSMSISTHYYIDISSHTAFFIIFIIIIVVVVVAVVVVVVV